jgi:alcohol dehydrogenase class IV
MLGTYTPTPLKKVHYGPKSLETQLLPSIRFLLAQAQNEARNGEEGEEVKEEDVKGKVMIITGRSLMEKTPVIKDVEKVLMKAGFYGLTFSDIAQHARKPIMPLSLSLSYSSCRTDRYHSAWFAFVYMRYAAIKDIQRAKQLALDNEIDLLLSIGGGSPIDSTKAISYFVREAKGGKGAFLPHIAVPTTLSVAETTQ